MKTSILSVIAVPCLSACTTTKTVPVVVVRERRVEVTKSLLTCSPEPVAESVWVTQRDVARYLVRLAEPGKTAALNWPQ